ncbi:MAG: hypothetical protein J6A05_10610 [Oscillospiraceae bacterium]|nr:hypothetical protein [Oscillospiraceae bacterium]
MKKLLSILTVIAVCASLTACSNTEATADTTTTTAETTTVSEVSETTVITQKTVDEEPAETYPVTEAVTEEVTAETNKISETIAAVEETTVADAETEAAATEAETTQAETEASDEEEIVADDSAEEITVNNKFADMDEFLTADIFMLDGKTVTADKSLSASIFKTLDGNFYFETSAFDGGSPFRFAVKGDMVMTETEMDGKTNKMVIRDSKAYTFDHENKVALFIPAEKELLSQYKPEKMGIIPENISKEKLVIADVTIGGKAYQFEYSTVSDWAMLYTSDGKLYASVKSGDSLDLSLCKFSVTSKIPSGTFDIPEDYFQLNLEEMMQNAPPPENKE